MALVYLHLNSHLVVFLRLTTNSARLNTFQRREKVEQHIWQIFWKCHESNRVFDRVMTLALEAFFMFEGCLSAKNKTLRSISIRKSILWLISHLHTIENTILGGDNFYKRPIKVKFQGQSQNERFFCNIRRTVHILYTLKEGKTITMINYVCPENCMKIDWELIELWPLVSCLKMIIL